MIQFANIAVGEMARVILKDDDGFLWLEIIDPEKETIPGGHGVVILDPDAVEDLIEALEDYKAGLPSYRMTERIHDRFGSINLCDVKLGDWWMKRD